MVGVPGKAKKKSDSDDDGWFSKSALGKLFTGAKAGEGSKASSMDMPDSAYAAGSRKAMMDKKEGNKGEMYKAPKAASAPSRPTRKPAASGYSSGSIDNRKPNADLGAFYLNATSGMDNIFKRGKKK